MANTDTPYGFIPQNIGKKEANSYEVSSENGTAILKNAPVAMSSGYIVNATAGAGNRIKGIAAEYIAASTAKKDFAVWDDPDMIFKAQADGAGLTQADVGKNVNFVSDETSGNGVNSAAEIDGSSEGAGSTLQFRLLGLSREMDLGAKAENAWGAHAKVLVRINYHEDTYLGT